MDKQPTQEQLVKQLYSYEQIRDGLERQLQHNDTYKALLSAEAEIENLIERIRAIELLKGGHYEVE